MSVLVDCAFDDEEEEEDEEYEDEDDEDEELSEFEPFKRCFLFVFSADVRLLLLFFCPISTGESMDGGEVEWEDADRLETGVVLE